MTRNAIRKKVAREAQRLGLKYPVKLLWDEGLRRNALASYCNLSGIEHEVRIRTIGRSPQDVTETVRHELFHAYQHECDDTRFQKEKGLSYSAQLFEIEAKYYQWHRRKIVVSFAEEM